MAADDISDMIHRHTEDEHSDPSIPACKRRVYIHTHTHTHTHIYGTHNVARQMGRTSLHEQIDVQVVCFSRVRAYTLRLEKGATRQHDLGTIAL